MTPSRRFRHLATTAAYALGMPLAILTAQFAGTTLPLIPAAIIAAIACGGMALLLMLSLWKLVS